MSAVHDTLRQAAIQEWYEEWWLADQVLPGLADVRYDRMYDARLVKVAQQ